MSEPKTALDRFVALRHRGEKVASNEYLDAIPADAPEQIVALKAEVANLQTLYQTERELRKKAQGRLHDLDTGTQAEAIQGEASWRERAMVGERALAAAREHAEALVRALIELRDVLARTIGLRCGRSRMVQIIGDAVTSYRKANPKVAVCVRCGKPFTITNETRRCKTCAKSLGDLTDAAKDVQGFAAGIQNIVEERKP